MLASVSLSITTYALLFTHNNTVSGSDSDAVYAVAGHVLCAIHLRPKISIVPGHPTHQVVAPPLSPIMRYCLSLRFVEVLILIVGAIYSSD